MPLLELLESLATTKFCTTESYFWWACETPDRFGDCLAGCAIVMGWSDNWLEQLRN
ncbi:hypothetical protein Spb1_06820 [Planctopirus ephydatiae]|jgi:hypothetical protein|uniref:Uncharacterized protein n=1 Tax=Planctopirus ephydatiae TaxID=2528019 RepID=A0A518GJR4_9PLAN|nr:hypothetical protein Spb1_06820 [Planctopirus ephydatiae]